MTAWSKGKGMGKGIGMGLGGARAGIFRRFAGAGFSLSLIAGALGLAGMAGSAQAGERRFTYVYEVTTQPVGKVEYEQWVTFKYSKPTDSSYFRAEFRHEIELGLTDRLQLGLYLADWRNTSGKSVADDTTEYRSSGFELIYNLTNPTTDPVGLALYGEYKGGPDVHVLEGKILVQKNLGPWVLGYNAILEAEWEKDGSSPWESFSVFGQTAGVSYQVAPYLTLGGELVHEVEFPAWQEQDDHVVWVGPNVSYRSGTWWVTVTQLFQITDIGGQPDFQTRFLIGFDF